jgi:hypothetical protein
MDPREMEWFGMDWIDLAEDIGTNEGLLWTWY